MSSHSPDDRTAPPTDPPAADRERFTGERLHADDELFRVDLARHEAAYRYAETRLDGGCVLDMGSGSGYGVDRLRRAGHRVCGVDLELPDARYRSASFLRADITALPFPERTFRGVLSFQVIEHILPLAPYLDSMRRVLHEDGVALLTTPNRLTSDGENPYHVHEYVSDELADCLGEFFEEVEMVAVGATPAASAFYRARQDQIARIVRLDPLRLRSLIPESMRLWLFARLAIVVRKRLRGAGVLRPEITWRDFPVVEPHDESLDLVAICRKPRARASIETKTDTPGST